MPADANMVPTYWDQVQATIVFTASSVGMMGWNKLAVMALPLATFLVIIQNFATLAMLFLYPPSRKDIAPLEKEKVKKWIPVVTLFVMMLVSSLKTLLYLNVSTVLIFRNLTNIVTSIAEWYFLNNKVNVRIAGSLAGILVGIVMYGHNNAEVNFWGTFWMIFNAVAQVTYSIYVKWVITHAKIDLTKYGMSFYNNVLSVPILGIVMLCFDEHTRLWTELAKVSFGGWVNILLSCIIAFFISTTGFHLQKLVTATSFMVINNLNKILVIFFGIIVLKDNIEGVEAVLGCCVSLGSGFWYSYERFRQQEEEKREREREQNPV